MRDNIIHKEESYLIQGAIFDVYREMGCGFQESVLNQTYRPDVVCYNSIIIELKALSKTTSQHKAQVINYLKASRLKLGLLVNFGSYPKATIERIVL